MFDCVTALAHLLGMFIEPLLNLVKEMFMLPADDPAFPGRRSLAGVPWPAFPGWRSLAGMD